MKLDILPFKEKTDVPVVEEANNDTVFDNADAEADSEDAGGETEDKPEKKRAMKLEVKEFESKTNAKGETVTIEVKEKVKDKKNEQNEQNEQNDAESAMTSTKHFNAHSSLTRVEVGVYSAHIMEALRSVVKSYPFVSLEDETCLFSGKTTETAIACLFHYRHELEEYVNAQSDLTNKLHVSLALKFAEREFHDSIRRYRIMVQDAVQPVIEFADLWMIFRPGQLLYMGERSWEQRIVRLQSISYVKSRDIFSERPEWTIEADALAFDGESFGYITQSYQISEYEMAKKINELPIYPLSYHKAEEELREKMLHRGKRYCDLAGIRYQAYSGLAKRVDHERSNGLFGIEENYPEVDMMLEGRVMVDCTAFLANRTSRGISLSRWKNRMTVESISQEDLLICNNRVAGYSLSDKYWCWLFVDKIDEITFDEDAWSGLMLESMQKRIVRALTMHHISGVDDFDDMIQKKGKGCIFLFHGEPGIGKTFTVESIAESIKAPLYVVGSGDLGLDVTSVEKNLKSVFKLVNAWKAVLLIDEADIFLEQRSSRDLRRNGLVSIFLRLLEYYTGILFMTTNRITSFDLAFKSRIHLALKYPSFTDTMRESLWRVFLGRTSDFIEADWSEAVIKEISRFRLNGRQIKNTVRTAQALALSEKRKLLPSDINDVLQTVKQFEIDLNEKTQADTGMAPTFVESPLSPV